MIHRTRAVIAALAVGALIAVPLAAQTLDGAAPNNEPAPQAAPPPPETRGAPCGQRIENFIYSMLDRVDGIRPRSRAEWRALQAFRSASADALDFVRDACADPQSAAGLKGLEDAEKKMEAALRALGPALQNFQSSLSDEQKAQLEALGRQIGAMAQDWLRDFTFELERSLRDNRDLRSNPDELRFCFGGFCVSAPKRMLEGRRDDLRTRENSGRL